MMMPRGARIVSLSALGLALGLWGSSAEAQAPNPVVPRPVAPQPPGVAQAPPPAAAPPPVVPAQPLPPGAVEPVPAPAPAPGTEAPGAIPEPNTDPAPVAPGAEPLPGEAPRDLYPAPPPAADGFGPEVYPPPTAPPEAIAGAPLEASEEEPAWYDSISFGAFADAYFAADFNFPKSELQTRRNPIRAYDTASGFALSWVGLDIQKEADPVGGVLSLRFGPTARSIAGACIDAARGGCDVSNGLENVKQGYASWRPADVVTFDLGKFDTPYGAEVAEAQYNLNYTRGVLYWLGQPLNHTGLRVGIDLAREFNLKLLAVNGWNRTIDNNVGKSFGVQGALRVPKSSGSDEDVFTVALGYLGGPEHADTEEIQCPPDTAFDPSANPETGCVSDPGGPGGSGVVDRGAANTEGLRHFIDLSAVANPVPALKIVFNASLGFDNARSEADITDFETKSWYGVMAGARYALNDRLGLGGRVEYYGDPDGYSSAIAPEDMKFVTGTATLDFAPAEQLRLFLDARLDWCSKMVFPKAAHDDPVGTDFSATIGAVVSTN